MLGDGSPYDTARISDGGWWPYYKLHAASMLELETLFSISFGNSIFFFSFDLSVHLCRHGQDCVNALVRISYHTWVLLCPLCSSLLSSNQMWVSLLLDQKMKMVNLMTRGMSSFSFHIFDSITFSLCSVSWITFIFWWYPYDDGNVESSVWGHRYILRIWPCHVDTNGCFISCIRFTFLGHHIHLTSKLSKH